MTDWSAQTLPEHWAGYEMVAVDATAFSGKHAAGTDARAHVAMRLADLSLLSIEVTDMTGGETFKRFIFEQDQLVVADRGYCKLTFARSRNSPGR